MSTCLSYFKMSFFNHTVYRIECLMGILNTCLQIFISCAIWKVLYGGNSEVNNISYAMVATNLIVAQGLSNAFRLNDFAVQQKLWDGSIAIELLKPIDLRVSMLAWNLGDILFSLLTNFLPSVIIAGIFIGLLPPSGLLSVFLFIISIILSFAILWSMSTIVQMSAFWILNVWSLATLKDVLIRVLAGASLPLWFMPDAVLTVIKYTPFESVYFIPIQIYLGKIGVNDVLSCYFKQALWFIVLYLIGIYLWHCGKKKIVVQGG